MVEKLTLPHLKKGAWCTRTVCRARPHPSRLWSEMSTVCRWSGASVPNQGGPTAVRLWPWQWISVRQNNGVPNKLPGQQIQILSRHRGLKAHKELYLPQPKHQYHRYTNKSMWTPLQMSGFGYFSHTRCWQVYKIEHTWTNIGSRMACTEELSDFQCGTVIGF